MNVEIKRSKRRKKTIAARREGDKMVVFAPNHLTDNQVEKFIIKVQEKWVSEEQKRKETLLTRTKLLNRKYLEGRADFSSIRFVTNQSRRFGSCSPSKKTIRLSTRLLKVPEYVLDYVIIHELAHLLVPNHSGKFWALVNRYPRTERARGYLQALSLEKLD